MSPATDNTPTRDAGRVRPRASRLRGLDALRGLAASAVVLNHFGYGYSGAFGVRVTPLIQLEYGHLGVELFFIISGFVILRTLERCRGLADFVVSRVSRLYPAYLACACLSAALVFAAGLNWFRLTPRDAMLNVFMISDLLGVKQIDNSYWTLQYEVLFYTAAATVYFGLGVRRVEIACLVWLAFMPIGHFLAWPHLHSRLAMLLDVQFANLFVIGMMIHRLTQFPRARLALLTLAAGVALALIPHHDASAPILFPATVVFAAAVWLAARDRLGLLCVWPLLFLGDISYSLYLVHQIVGYWVMQRIGALGWNATIGEALAIVVVIGLATAIRTWVEIPAQRAIRTAYRRLGGITHATEPPAVA